MGRPSTDDGGRTERVYVRLTTAEAAALADRAAAAGLSVSDYVRTTALGADPTRRRAMPADVAQVVRHLSAVGNNLNQLARACNQSGTAPLPPVLEHACGEVVRIIRELSDG